MEITKTINIFACATDPGGARNIAPVLKEALKVGHNIFVCCSNNTKNIFDRYNIKSNIIDNLDYDELKNFIINFNSSLIFCGATRFGYNQPELLLIELSKNLNLKSAVIFDEWFYYAKRFKDQKGNLLYLPNIIFCQNKLAFNEASKEGVPENLMVITGSPSYSEIYFKNKNKAKIKKIKNSNKVNILFVSEAHSEAYGSKAGEKGPHGIFQGYTEKDVRKTLSNILVKINKDFVLVEKLHPNQKQAFLKPINTPNVEWKIIKNASLDELIINSDIIVGMRSAVLMEAYLLGKKVFSYQPNLLVENKCSASRLGYISHISDEEILYKNIKEYLLNTNIKTSTNNTIPDFCDINASKNVLESLIEISK